MDIQAHLSEVRVFTAVAASASLKEAAVHLGISGPAVTESLDRLEERVFSGHRLVVRRGRSLRLTPIGDAFLPVAQRFVQALEVLKTETAVVLGEPRVVRVGTMQGAWKAVIAAAVERLDVDIELRHSAADPYWPVAPLLVGQLEWMLLPAPSDHDEKLDRIPVFAERRFVSVASEGPLGELETVTLQQLNEYPWLGTPPAADKTFTEAHRCDDLRKGPPPRIGPFFTNPIEIGYAIADGHVIVATMPSITQVFNVTNIKVKDVAIEGAPPWQIDLVRLRKPLTHGTLDFEAFADSIARSAIEAGAEPLPKPR